LTGRKTGLHNINPAKAYYVLAKNGFNHLFEVRENSRASGVAENLEEKVENFQNEKDSSINDYLKRCSTDELSYKSLLRSAHYLKACLANQSDSNLLGFVFSDKDHLKIIEDEFKLYKRRTAVYYSQSIDTRKILAGLKKGAPHLARINMNKELEIFKEKNKYLDNMAFYKTTAFKLTYNITSDKELFYDKFNLEEKTLSELKEGLNDKDISNAAKQRLFYCLLSLGARREALFLASFKKGLKKVLAS
jgi:hypothetical protein